MRVFKTTWFSRFAHKEEISDQKLADTVRDIEKGPNDADSGRGLVKKRVARAGRGKRGGYRTIIVYRAGDRAIFLYGFSKSAKVNLSALELEALQKVAQIYPGLTVPDIAKALKEGELEEVNYNGKEIPK